MPTIKDVTWNVEAATIKGLEVQLWQPPIAVSPPPPQGVPFLAQAVFLQEVLAPKCTKVQGANREQTWPGSFPRETQRWSYQHEIPHRNHKFISLFVELKSKIGFKNIYTHIYTYMHAEMYMQISVQMHKK